MKRFLASGALFVVSLAAALALGEVAVRALFKDATVLFPRYHTEYRYGDYTLRGIRPKSEFWHTSADGSWKFVTNSRGLRDARDFPYDKPAGTLRVLALGDSHTQGYEVRQEATYAAVLERYLNAKGKKAEVLNAGVSGFSTAEAAAYLENEGHRYRPDVVVLGFYANDFEDNLKAGLFALEADKLVARKHEHIPGVRIQNLIYAIPGVQWLGENSYFYSLLFNQVWMYAKAALRERTVRHARAAEAPDDGEFEFALATNAEQPAHAVDLAVALIERMQRFCSERAIRLLVAEIPQPGASYRLRASLPESVLTRLAQAGIEVIDSRALLGGFEGAAEMHVPGGHRHISEFTHTLIAAELGQRILRR